jgi:photosystem II stability/assembly factor-like uncharacterized protein
MLHPLIRKLYPLVLACVCALSLTQCKKSHTNPAPPASPAASLVKPPKSMQVIRGNNLVGGINVHLYDSIVVRIIPNDPSDAEKYFFNTTTNDSVGAMQVMGPELDSGGVNVTMFWQTGRQSPRQDVKFYLISNCTSKGCQLLDSVTISAVIKPAWTPVYSDPGYGTLTDIRFISNQSALAVGNYAKGIVRTSDGGASWNATPAFRSDLEQLCFLDSLNGFVTVSNNYAYLTTDGGKTFTQGPWAPPAIGDWSSQDFSMVSASTIYSVGFQGAITKTINGGQSWQKYPGFSFINAFYAISCVDADHCFACGEAGKVVKTSNGGQDWQSLNINLNNHLHAICFLNRDIGFAGGQNGALIRTSDGGSSWTLVPSGLLFTILSIRFFDAQHGVMVSELGEIADTKDGGITWQRECPGSNGISSTLQKAAIRDAKTVFALQGGAILKYNITQ